MHQRKALEPALGTELARCGEATQSHCACPGRRGNNSAMPSCAQKDRHLPLTPSGSGKRRERTSQPISADFQVLVWSPENPRTVGAPVRPWKPARAPGQSPCGPEPCPPPCVSPSPEVPGRHSLGRQGGCRESICLVNASLGVSLRDPGSTLVWGLAMEGDGQA